MTTTTDTAAGRIQQARLAEERSEKWVAEKAGIAVPTFRRKLRGGGDFTVSEVARVAKVLGVDPISLLPSEFHAQERAA